MKKNSEPKQKFNIRNFSIFRRLPLLLSLTRRGMIFFMFLLIAQLLLFLTGNIQHFLDENQTLTLKMCSYAAIGMGFFSFAAVIECIYYIVTSKKAFFYVHLAIFFILFLLASFVCFGANFIFIVSDGLA